MLAFHLKKIALSQTFFFAKCYSISFNIIIIVIIEMTEANKVHMI